jgi:hypothetical protein
LEKENEPGWFTTIINLPMRPAEPVPEFDPDIDSRELHEALSRLEGHGLIAGEHGETLGGTHWSRPRVRAAGLIVLGEWPDLDHAVSVDGLTRLLVELSQTTAAGDRHALQQTAGAIARLGEGIVTSVVESAGEAAAG